MHISISLAKWPHDNRPVCVSSSLQTQMNLQLCFINNSESEEEDEEKGGEMSMKEKSSTQVSIPVLKFVR